MSVEQAMKVVASLEAKREACVRHCVDAGLLGRISTMRKSILISEIFGPTVQGEGPLIGLPTVFVRTGGCDYRCAWCDRLYAVLPKHRAEWWLKTPTEIERRIEELAGNDPVLVTLSGGNPALQPLAPLIELGHAGGHTFALETQGSVSAPWFSELDWLLESEAAIIVHDNRLECS